MIKTISLTANTEYKLENVNGKYALIKNLGSVAVYASKKSTIVADADDVQCVLPLSSEIIKDIQLENRVADLYFKTTENTKIEIQVSQDANFKKYLKGGEFGKSFSEEKVLTLTRLKALNTSGTWVSNAYTSNGITWTCTVEGDEVKSINANGTATAISTLLVKNPNNPATILSTSKNIYRKDVQVAGAHQLTL